MVSNGKAFSSFTRLSGTAISGLLLVMFCFPMTSHGQCDELYSTYQYPFSTPLALPPHPNPNSVQKPGYTLIFQDEFDAPLNLNVWELGHNVCYGSGSFPAVDLGVSYLNENDPLWGSHSTVNVDPDQGFLQIIMVHDSNKLSSHGIPDDQEFCSGAKKEKAENIAYFTGLVQSRKQYIDFKHGYFEMRCRLPKGNNMWPAFWMFHHLDSTDPVELETIRREGGEIDIFEIYTNDLHFKTLSSENEYQYGTYSPSNYHFMIAEEIPNSEAYILPDDTPNPYNLQIIGGDESDCSPEQVPLNQTYPHFNCYLNTYQYPKQGKTWFQTQCKDWACPELDPTENFYTFGLEWNTNSLDYYINDVLVRRVRDCNVPDVVNHLIMNIGAIAPTASHPMVEEHFPASLDIDYVRVYKKIDLEDFGSNAGGWDGYLHRRMMADVNGDGLDDIVGFGHSQVLVALAYESWEEGPAFRHPTPVLDDFCHAQDWFPSDHPIYLKDMNQDGKADIVGFWNDGVYAALSNSRPSVASFRSSKIISDAFKNDDGFHPATTPRMVGDMNGDGWGDLLAFGESGLSIAYANPNLNDLLLFSTPELALPSFGLDSSAGNWNTTHHRRLIKDLNQDGADDIIGFASSEVFISYAQPASGNFSDATPQNLNHFCDAQGWSVASDPLYLANVNGDHYLDIVGFNQLGVTVALGKENGFLNPQLALQDFKGGLFGNWNVLGHLRMVGDYTGDGKDDIIGFWNDGVYLSSSNSTTTGAHFLPKEKLLPYFGLFPNPGHQSTGFQGFAGVQNPRLLADVNGDEALDIVAFGNDGVYLNLSSFGCKNRDISTAYGGSYNCWYAHPNPHELGSFSNSDPTLDGGSTDDLTGLILAPNPNQGRFAVEMRFHQAKGQLFDAQGKLIWQGELTNHQEVDFNLTPGVYLLQVQYQEKSFHQKLMVVQ